MTENPYSPPPHRPEIQSEIQSASVPPPLHVSLSLALKLIGYLTLFGMILVVFETLRQGGGSFDVAAIPRSLQAAKPFLQSSVLWLVAAQTCRRKLWVVTALLFLSGLAVSILR